MAEDTAEKPAIRRVRPKVNPFKEAVKEVKAAEAEAAAAPEPENLGGAEREPMRAEMQADDSMARAAMRAAELTEHMGDEQESTDKFYIPPEIIPAGWSYEWKRKYVLGKEDPAYAVQLRRAGWDPVPAARHPEMMPLGSDAATIERDGQILMERPLIITERAKAADLRRARAQVGQKESQLSQAEQGQFARDNKGAPLVKVQKSYDGAIIPKN